MKKLSIQTKLLTSVGLLILSVIIILSALISVKEEKKIIEETYSEMGNTSTYLSRRIGHHLFNSNLATIQSNLMKSMTDHPEILYYFVHNLSGTIVLALDEGLIGGKTPGTVPGLDTEKLGSKADKNEKILKGSFNMSETQLLSDANFLSHTRGYREEVVYDTTKEIIYLGKPVGYLRLGFTRKDLYKRIHDLRCNIILTGFSILFPVLLCIFLIIRKNVKPLSILTSEIYKIKKGINKKSIPELLKGIDTSKINVTATEVVELKESIEEIMEILIENWNQLEDQRFNLEENVIDRTEKLIDSNVRLKKEIQDKNIAENNLKIQNNYMEALHKTTLDVISHLEISELLKTVILRAGELIGTENGYIYLYNEDRETLELSVGTGIYSEKGLLSIPQSEGLVGKIWNSKNPLYVNSYNKWNTRLNALIYDNLFSTIGVPVYIDGNIAGVLGLGFFNEEYIFSDKDINILSRFGELASIALNNSNLHTKIQEELSERQRVEREKTKIFQHLLQVQKLESLGTLAGGIAHDINNLLMAIQGNLSIMLLHAGDDDPFYERGKNIETLVKSGAELTSQLLGFARGGKYNVKPVDINTIVSKSISIFGRTRKEITIHESYGPKEMVVEVDKTQIEQVLLNLFLNASHAMPGGGNLYISTQTVHLEPSFVEPYNVTEGHYIKLSVRDTGSGMNKTTLSKIFDPFFTTKEMGRGTGLGLASAYGIINNHSGIIEVSSSPGFGTTFEIYLALSDKNVSNPKNPDPCFKKGSGKVLIVDDEPDIREITQEMLSELGYSCVTAESGNDGIEKYREKHKEIDLVILDMVMPDKGGESVYKALCQINPYVKVLLSSGYSIKGEAEKIISSGCDSFIQKPFNIHELSENITRILKKPGPAAKQQE